MIQFKELRNRTYDGKICVQFEYVIQLDDRQKVIARFERKVPYDGSLWVMQVILDRNAYHDCDVYNFAYALPKSNLPLETIASMGLKYFQFQLKEEIQLKSMLDFCIGDKLGDTQ